MVKSTPSEPPSDSPEAEEDLTSRSDLRRAEREREDALARLAKELVELRQGWLDRLDLPEALLDIVSNTRAIKSPPARNRQLRLVRSALRSEDWSLIRARVDAVVKHGVVPASLATNDASAGARAPEWVARLLGEGTSAIEALLEIAPSADRTHLRNLVRETLKASADRRKKAEERLMASVKSLLR